ncbi:MAG: ABC transporter permease [Planctomycetota bacterium]
MAKPSWTQAIKTGVSSLLLHKLRSALTTLGVLFGTSSVIAMLAIGEGGSYEAQEQIRLLGSQNVILRSVKPPQEAGGSNQQSRILTYGLLNADFDRVRETFPAVALAVPVREFAKEVRVGARVSSPRILATEPSYIDVTGRIVAAGRFLIPDDERVRRNVCVLSTELARKLFPFESSLGKEVRIESNYFVVVGTLLPRVPTGDDPAKVGADVTGELFIPLATANDFYGVMQVKQSAGTREMEEVELHEVILGVDHPENVALVANASREMLRRFHKKHDHDVVVPLELLARAEETKRIFNIVLGSIAGISLLVGGIGIMNVMLATVTERTREIGIRRALGAKRRHIVSQFLIETVVLSVGGGLAGVGLGLLIPEIVERFADLKTIVTPMAPVLAFCISAGVGVIFGLYPAWRAATMDPVEALRHE